MRRIRRHQAAQSVPLSAIRKWTLICCLVSVVMSPAALGQTDPNFTPPCSGIRYDLTYWTTCKTYGVGYLAVAHPTAYYGVGDFYKTSRNDQALLYLSFADELTNARVNQVGNFNGNQVIGIIRIVDGTNPILNIPNRFTWIKKNSQTTLVTPDTMQRTFEATVSLVDGTRDLIVAWIASNGDRSAFLAQMGDRISTGLGTTVGRLAGLVSQIGQGLLDAEVAVGVRTFYEAWADRSSSTQGLLGSTERRRLLQQILTEIDRQGQPIKPIRVDGSVSTFGIAVGKGKPNNVDPPLATGYEYRIGAGNPRIASIALPLLTRNQRPYSVQVLQSGAWRTVFLLSPLRELKFSVPQSRFRVIGVPIAAKLNMGNDPRWVSMISFEKDGYFSGTVTALSN